MAVKLAFNRLPQFFDANSVALTGGLLYTYVAGSTTPQTTYQDSLGNTQHANPIVLDSRGEPPAPIWLTSGQTYKFTLKTAAGVTIWTVDAISGINDTTSSFDQWVSGAAPTYVSATSFTLVGDQTGTFTVGRRVKTTNTGGTIYSTISASVFGALTTVTVVNDSGTLDSGLTAVSYGLISPTSTSLPPNLGVMTTKGDIVVASTSGRGVRVAVGSSNGQALSADSSQTAGVVYIDNPSRPNLLINPNWQIDQINEGALYTYSATAAVGPDGWSGSATGAGVFKLRTLADPENAALKCLEITCTTADAALAATDNYFIYTAVEGYDAAGLMAGTSAAQSITIQFKFKSNVNGVYGVSVANSATNRSYVGSFTVASSAEAEYSVTLTMDTTGTWLYTNGVGIYARISLAAGSNFETATGSWGANNMFATAGNANFMSANTNVAYLKRIQLIQGALVQAYKPADVRAELAKCQRYYWKSFPQGTAVAQNAGVTGAINWTGVNASTQFGTWCPYKVEMRATPTGTVYNPSAANAQARDVTAGVDCTSSGIQVSGTTGALLFATQTAGGAQGNDIAIHVTANARLT